MAGAVAQGTVLDPGLGRHSTARLSVFAAVASLCFVLTGVISAGAGFSSRHGLRGFPLALGHSHNDEAQALPLETALSEGFCSIEADTFVIDGQLLVAHDLSAVDPAATLQRMYLDPLAAAVGRQDGRVYPTSKYARVCDTVVLLVDLKDGPGVADGNASFAATHAVLELYQRRQPGLFTEWDEDGQETPGALKVLFSGARPSPDFVLEHCRGSTRLGAIDGRIEHLDSGHPASLIPTISHAWCCHAGDVTRDSYHAVSPTVQQLAQARTLVERAHRQGRLMRFWGGPDTPTMWQLVIDLGADYVNTDDLAGLRRFVAAKMWRRPRPLHPWRLRVWRTPVVWHVTVVRTVWRRLTGSCGQPPCVG